MTIVARYRRLLALAALSVVLGASTASLASPGSQAERAASRAMNELFSAARFEEAKTALEASIRDCGGCSKHTRALLHLDLGIVLVTGLGDAAQGRAEMKSARTLDPALSLDPAFVTDDVQAAFDAGKGPSETAVVLEEDTTERDEKENPPSERKEAPEKTETTETTETTDHPLSPESERPVWLSLGLIQDLAFASGTDVCTEDSQVGSSNTCLRTSGSQYHGTPLPGEGGKLGGASLATTRLTLASYFVLSDDLSAGVRVGYALAGKAPTPDGGRKFFPLHAEIQLSYWFSEGPLSAKHVGTFAEASTGFAQMVGHGSVQVGENTAVPPPISQLDNPPSQKLNAYQTSGSAFAGLGAGLFVPFGAATALIADLRLSLFFPTSGFAVSLGAGVAFGP